MKISIYHKAFKVILSPMARILFAAGVLLSACAEGEQAPSPTPGEHTATLQLVFKQQGPAAEPSLTQLKGTDSFATDAPLTMDAGTTRAPLTRAVNETDIQTVDVLSFKVNPSDPTNIKEGTFFYRSKGTYTQTTPGQGRVEVKLIGSPEAQTLVVLANARTQVDALGATYGEQKEAVMARLLLPATADGTPDFTNGMPMWGELPNEVVDKDFSPSDDPKEVTMIRSVVKFTYREKTSLLYSPSGINLWYNGLQFEAYNFRSKGRVAPDNFRPASLSVATPTVPAGATQAQGTHHTLSDYVPLTYNGSGGEVSFYMFESDNSKANTGSALDATCLVVHFLGGPATGWHRLDFRNYAQPAGTGFMDLLRGHHYVIEPEEWDGTQGALTAEEAFKGVSKIKCRIVPWNEVQEEVKVEGNKRLTVDKRVFQFPGDPNVAGETGGTQTLTLSTENTGGWRIDGKPDWVNLSQTSGADGTPATVTLSVGVNPGRTDRTAVMNLVAGNLTYKIHLSQPDACGKNGVPKKMRIGNNDYYTHRFGGPNGQCWMLENSREGTADAELPPLPGRTHKRYLWNGWNAVRRDKAGFPAGWDIPTYMDVYNLRKTTFSDGTGTGIGTEKWFWLQWQKDPGVLSYHPAFDGNGPVVNPSPDWSSIGGRTSDKFWPGDYQNWEYRRLPRLASYIRKQQDNISAFWSYQNCTNPSMNSGVQEIPAANGQKMHAHVGRMPIVTVNIGIPNKYQSCIHIATTLREPGTHMNAYDRASDWLTLHWWVNPDTGDNWSWGYNGPWGKKGLLRKATSSHGWFGPSDMPWRLTSSHFYDVMIERDGATSADLFVGGQHYYKPKNSGSTYEYNFYPGANELFDYNPSLPGANYNLDFKNQTGLGAYMENLLPLRFVRRD
ncbi:BACON domain-containing protein [Bacteroides pyogenes]|uniref:BACON domain-containing protein n=1 Tax=Bacteroides pyogenes TaxID=310300 RepID=UPI001F1C7645|nr:BACON domain-containing protein [Bacteroides pyogenes]MCE9108428.1 BACON domain-containing protein [Bacteroides pyogenes]